MTPGVAGTVSNSQCTISGTGASVTSSGNNLTVAVPITFQTAFTGIKNVYLSATDDETLTSGWQLLGQAVLSPGRARGEESAATIRAGRIFRMAVEIERDGPGGGRGLMDQRRSRRQGVAEEFGRDLVVGAPEYGSIGRSADAPGERFDVTSYQTTQLGRFETCLDIARQRRARLGKDGALSTF